MVIKGDMGMWLDRAVESLESCFQEFGLCSLGSRDSFQVYPRGGT